MESGMDARLVAMVQLLARRAAECDYDSYLHQQARAKEEDGEK